MSKSVLVMETPEDCESCVLHGGIFHSFCKINCRYIEDLSSKPDWCPLMDLPKKTMEIIQPIRLMLALRRDGTSVLMRLQEEMQMIDLRNTCILVKTKEENEMILKEAEKQGFYWYGKDHCEPLRTQYFPDILKFYEHDITYAASARSDFAFCEASELLGIKENDSKRVY